MSHTEKISASKCQNFHIINDFMEAVIDWILTNQQIPDNLSGAAPWRHMGSQKWCWTQVEAQGC